MTAHCPLCGSGASLRFSVPCDWRKPDIAQTYSVYWCHPCDYGQIWERPTAEEITGFYQLDTYYTHDGGDASGDAPRPSILDKLRVHIAWRLDSGTDLSPDEALSRLPKKKLSVCEIGCGNGNNLKQFAEHGFTVYGVEPDPSSRAIAQETFEEIYEGTAEELPEPIASQKYDVVLMSHVLEHCQDVTAAVDNAKSLLTDNGVFIVETPNCKALGFDKYEGGWPWSDIPRHLNFFTPHSLATVVENSGLDVVEKKYRGFYRQFLDWWLEHEEIIWNAFAKHDHHYASAPRFNQRAWGLLLSSVLAPQEKKYDSIRIIAIPKNDTKEA